MGYLDGFGVTFRKLCHGSDDGRVVTSSTRRRSARKPMRLHGRHVLNRYEDGMEKCIGCELCAGVCPARCIYVRGADNPPDDPVARASATASSTRSTTCAASTATCASRPARPRPSPRRSCSSSRSPTARTRSTPRTSCSSTTTASPSTCRGRTGARARTSTRSAWMRATAPSGDAAVRGPRGLVGRARLRRARARGGPGRRGHPRGHRRTTGRRPRGAGPTASTRRPTARSIHGHPHGGDVTAH